MVIKTSIILKLVRLESVRESYLMLSTDKSNTVLSSMKTAFGLNLIVKLQFFTVNTTKEKTSSCHLINSSHTPWRSVLQYYSCDHSNNSYQATARGAVLSFNLGKETCQVCIQELATTYRFNFKIAILMCLVSWNTMAQYHITLKFPWKLSSVNF